LSRPALAAGLGAAVTLCGALLSASGQASPDGAEWTSADQADGCRSCHLADEPPIESPALALTGLPQVPEAGRDYPLTISLEDPLLRNAGFLLTVRTAGNLTGEFTSAGNARIETSGAQARSTYDGSFVETPGRAEWQLVWTAPEAFDGPLSFELWGNAGNRDLSPLDDRIYRGSWQITP
jgi:hypothetical protein